MELRERKVVEALRAGGANGLAAEWCKEFGWRRVDCIEIRSYGDTPSAHTEHVECGLWSELWWFGDQGLVERTESKAHCPVDDDLLDGPGDAVEGVGLSWFDEDGKTLMSVSYLGDLNVIGERC